MGGFLPQSLPPDCLYDAGALRPVPDALFADRPRSTRGRRVSITLSAAAFLFFHFLTCRRWLFT